MLKGIFYGYVMVNCIVFNYSLFAAIVLPNSRQEMLFLVYFYEYYFVYFIFIYFSVDIDLLCKNSLGKFFNSLCQIFSLKIHCLEFLVICIKVYLRYKSIFCQKVALYV